MILYELTNSLRANRSNGVRLSFLLLGCMESKFDANDPKKSQYLSKYSSRSVGGVKCEGFFAMDSLVHCVPWKNSFRRICLLNDLISADSSVWLDERGTGVNLRPRFKRAMCAAVSLIWEQFIIVGCFSSGDSDGSSASEKPDLAHPVQQNLKRRHFVPLQGIADD